MKTPQIPVTVSRRRFIGQLSAATAGLSLLPRLARAADAPDPARKLGIALVGLGSYATNQLAPAIGKSNHWKLAGVVTGSPEKGRHWARVHDFPEKNIFGYDTMAGLANCPDIDVVYVVTPNALHAQHVIAAAKAGKHVITEKPMATSVADCDAMIGACRAAGKRLMVGYRLHYEPHTQEFCRLARENTFGGPFMRMKASNAFDMGDPDPADYNWRVNLKLAGGGPLMDMGVYVIQAVCMAKAEEPPIAVTAKFGPVTRPRLFAQVEQSITWTMEFVDGAVADCFASYDRQVSTIQADADHGWARIEDPAFYYAEPLLTTSQGPVIRPRVNHQLAQLDGMAAEILSGGPSFAPGEMGRRDIAITTAIYAAAASGVRTEVKA
jgi:glucose-fructose oxidoreductase